MASSPDKSLTAMQQDVLRSFFAHEHDFYLTGGAALVGYHLAHRTTDDLDLFTQDQTCRGVTVTWHDGVVTLSSTVGAGARSTLCGMFDEPR